MATYSINDYYVYNKATGELEPYPQVAAQPGFDVTAEVLFDPAGNKYVGSSLQAAIRANAGRFDVAGALAGGFIAYLVPVIGAEIGASLMAAGAMTSAASASGAVLAAGGTAAQAAAAASAATATATAVGTAVAGATVQVAQGVPLEKAVQNATVNAVVQTQSPDVAKTINTVIDNPSVTNLIVSTGASIASTAATGGSEADIVRNATGALLGSGVSSATDSNIAGRAAGGAVTGGVAGALIGAAGAAGARDAKEGASTTITPNTLPTVSSAEDYKTEVNNLLSQYETAGYAMPVGAPTPGITVTNSGPLIRLVQAAANDPQYAAKLPAIEQALTAAGSSIARLFNTAISLGTYSPDLNSNEYQILKDKLASSNITLSDTGAGAGRGFVNPPAATTITPSQAAGTETYSPGFSGAGGGAGAGVTAGEGTAGEQEARNLLAAQNVTRPEIDLALLAQEPALNEPPTDQKIIDLIQPSVASTPATTPPGTTPTDRDILNFSGITQLASTQPTAKLPAPVAVPGQATSVKQVVTPEIARPTAAVPEIPTRPANQPVVDTFDFPKVTPADQAVIDLITPPATTPIGEPPPFVPPAVEPPVTTPPVVSEPPPDVVEPPPVVTEPPPPPPEVVVEPEPPLVDVPPAEEVVPPKEEDKPPAEEEKPPEEEPPPPPPPPPPPDEPEYKPEIFIYGGKEPPRRPRPELRTTLQGPFAPSTTLGQALTGYRGAGEIEGKKTGKPRKNVWNEESLRLKDALGL
jgi:hypothetical protein